MSEDKEFIWARDPEGRAMLEEISEFDSRKTGRVNLSSTLHRILFEEYERIKALREYKTWKKERGQSN